MLSEIYQYVFIRLYLFVYVLGSLSSSRYFACRSIFTRNTAKLGLCHSSGQINERLVRVNVPIHSILP